MLDRQGLEAFDELVELAGIAQQSPSAAAMHAPQVYALARTLQLRNRRMRTPSLIIVPETDTEVVLNTALPHTASATVNVSFPVSGRVVGVGCDVAEGSQYRPRLEVRIDVQGINALVRQGHSTAAYAPLNALCGQNEDGMLYLPVDWRVDSTQEWSLTFRSVSAVVASTTRLTPRPFFLFVEGD